MLKIFAIENTWLSRRYMDFGWGNGYIIIPEGHPLHGTHYDKIEINNYPNGGFTFSDYASSMKSSMEIPECNDNDWIIGFDTAHLYDNLEKWPNEQSILDHLKPIVEEINSLYPLNI